MNKSQIEILYQDNEIVVINKPGGLLSVPGRGADKQDCVSKRLQNIFPAMIPQPSIHRLDMYTSGLMVYAITSTAHRDISIQFEKRLVQKKYQALLEGIIKEQQGQISLPFRLDPDNRPLQIYDAEKGKMGHTKWRKLGIEAERSRIEFTPLTGRTHQLRIHSSHSLGLGTPIIGDSLYGSGADGDQMMLHATFLSFSHPCSKKPIAFQSSPPF